LNIVVPTMSVRRCSFWRNTSATISSFHAQTRFTSPEVMIAGTERGSTMLNSDRKRLQPSIRAASRMASGTDRRKLRIIYTVIGRHRPQ